MAKAITRQDLGFEHYGQALCCGHSLSRQDQKFWYWDQGLGLTSLKITRFSAHQVKPW